MFFLCGRFRRTTQQPPTEQDRLRSKSGGGRKEMSCRDDLSGLRVARFDRRLIAPSIPPRPRASRV